MTAEQIASTMQLAQKIITGGAASADVIVCLLLYAPWWWYAHSSTQIKLHVKGKRPTLWLQEGYDRQAYQVWIYLQSCIVALHSLRDKAFLNQGAGHVVVCISEAGF